MKSNNYVQWLKLVTTQPHVFEIFLRRMFLTGLACECKTTGELYIGGNINSCLDCTDTFCVMDTHDFRATLPTGMIGWLYVIIQGTHIIIYLKL